MGFPRALHFIWLGEPIPDNRQRCIDSCIAKHPDWDVKVWTDVEEFGELRNRRVFDDAAQIAPKAPRGNPHQVQTNVLRFEVMLRFGGVFLDSDVWALRPIDAIIERAERENRSGVLGWEIQDRWLGEAVIACMPGAPFMARIVEHLEPWAFARARQATTRTVGPQFITPLLLGTPELEDVLVMPQPVFFPARHDQPHLADSIIERRVAAPGTWLVHRFGNFRRRQGMAWT